MFVDKAVRMRSQNWCINFELVDSESVADMESLIDKDAVHVAEDVGV